MFSFWQDPGAHGKPLVELFSPSIINLAESTPLAVASEFMLNRAWNLPQSNHVDLIETRHCISSIPIHKFDHITWGGLQPGMVSLATISQSIRVTGPLVPWFNVVWDSFTMPKYAFIFWLAIRNRLLTKDRMRYFRMQVDLRCV